MNLEFVFQTLSTTIAVIFSAWAVAKVIARAVYEEKEAHLERVHARFRNLVPTNKKEELKR